ncbi:HAD-IA family hydrolase [uncultured Jannaschia sp.]|uniref:HAD-IA family hydrolase n=1 Tax=uncultured Jannaschia sp. TaxID=293347 RepID=UPI002615D33A|nr:HAD-IA family hydrolase [uncultured Jannaschia sp.]
MSVSALLFGAIGTLAETTELQRRAYNRAFADADLDWVWDRDSYRKLLLRPGGRARIETYARDAGDPVDAATLHDAKIRHFEALIASEGLAPRDGVVEMIAHCRSESIAVGLATTTDRRQVDAILRALAPEVRAGDFDWIGDRSMVEHPKPSPDIYRRALGDLGVDADHALAIEDTPESAEAAIEAGLDIIGFPGAAAAERPFQPSVLIVETLRPRLLVMGRASGRKLAAQ